MNATANAVTERKLKRTMLPLLIVLFLISYCLLTKLVFEQDKTIDSQNSLIHQLFRDNIHLSALRKDHAGLLSRKAGAQSRTGIDTPSSAAQTIPSNQVPSIQSPSTQVPSTQVPSTQVPSAQVQVPSNTRPQANAKTDRKTRKAKRQLPTRPPAELTDPTDMRRVSFSI